jgi:hypothetical protein
MIHPVHRNNRTWWLIFGDTESDIHVKIPSAFNAVYKSLSRFQLFTHSDSHKPTTISFKASLAYIHIYIDPIKSKSNKNCRLKKLRSTPKVYSQTIKMRFIKNTFPLFMIGMFSVAAALPYSVEKRNNCPGPKPDCSDSNSIVFADPGASAVCYCSYISGECGWQCKLLCWCMTNKIGKTDF